MSASVFRLASAGETVRLSWRTNDGNNSLFPQAVIVDDTGTIVATKNLSVISVAGVAGAYEVSYTPATNGEFNIYYSVYTSSANRTAQTPVSELYEGNTEVLKVRSFPVFGNTASVGGLSDDDLKPVIEAIKKINVWSQSLASGRTAEQELLAKSEFNPQEEIVKTDIEIPEVNLAPLKNQLIDLEKKIPLLSQIKGEIAKIKEWIPEDKSPEVTSRIDSLQVIIQDIQPLLKEANNIEAISVLGTLLSETKEMIGSISNAKEILEGTQTVVASIEILKSSVESIGSISSLEEKFSQVNENINKVEKNLGTINIQDRELLEKLIGQLKEMMKKISVDISDIQQKEGILGSIKRLTEQLS